MSSSSSRSRSRQQPVGALCGCLPRAGKVAEILQYITLTVALGGIQFAWSVETGFGSLYLLSLGMKKSLVSLVWLAGPLSGLITQPLVGVFSDRCTAKLGRRRPYIIGATVAVVVCFGIIGWTREIVGNDRPRMAIWLAVAAFYVLDFAINCIQASLRALIVDMLPTARQDNGTAWASRMIGVGNVAGYLLGFLDLVHLFPFLGSSQMQILTSIASLALSSTVAITCFFTHEVPLSRAASQSGGGSGLQALGAIFTSIRSLPLVIKRVCRIQLFAWIGWFPFLFYSTTYVAGLYAASHSGNGESKDKLMEDGTRAGSLAMFGQAVSSLAFSVVLPAFTYSAASRAPLHRQGENRALRLVRKLRAMVSVGLPTMWAISLAVFSASMFATLFTSSVRGASWLIAVCGFSWAMAIWAPFSIIGETISSNSASLSASGLPMHAGTGTGTGGGSGDNHGYVPVDSTDIPMESMTADMGVFGSENGSRHSQESDFNGEIQSENPMQVQDQDRSQTRLSTGTILGIHNVFIVVPQFITAFVSSLLFAFFERKGGDAPDADSGAQHAYEIALVLRLGGVASAVAAYYAWRLQH
ncbi:hypothetical protein LPJ66_001665 [Kickxella alabastrina]|uniref:Uncharacterized protein n=1 Tax=Kickxella alabastrina TaxID=61397 RepID=A0ACC1ISP9_9FUNG|nr:hypothetical protein LPJ66_001665 [Kickxella alabastrina]